jgi:hypothetical protein
VLELIKFVSSEVYWRISWKFLAGIGGWGKRTKSVG